MPSSTFYPSLRSIRPTVPKLQSFLYPTPLVCWSDHPGAESMSRNMVSEPTPQQLITQSAQATANAITSALTARTASISLPIYDWDLKGCLPLLLHLSVHTLENWLLLNLIMHLTVRTSSDTVFAALGTKSLEMHVQWMPTGQQRGTESNQGKSFHAFLDQIQQGMTHDINTHVHLRELEDVVARPGEDPQDLIACIKTLMDCCEMISDDHHRAQTALLYHLCILPQGKAPWGTYGKTVQDTFLWASWHHHEPLCHSACPRTGLPQLQTCEMQSAMTSVEQPTPVTMVMVTHHLHPPRTAPIAHNSIQLAEQTAPHGIPIAPNATRFDTRDWSAVVASHFNQGMHLCQGMHPQLGHSMGSPDAHLGATTATLGGVVKQMP